MNSELRKVHFNLSNQKLKSYTIGDFEDDESGTLKERNGLFHCWGDEIYCDSETEEKFQRTIAIVEEIGTGEVYKVDPNTIVFIKEE